ncbi:DegT/DnrJ/EryC1/StrS family aminotransferase [Clostridium estertheticum]|nr:DegT/DnrJ/EryC1/StrS family aminotransferase [Clostridium estertheticum]
MEDKIAPNTKVILVLHIFGQSCKMDEIARIVTNHNLKLIEVSCRSV